MDVGIRFAGPRSIRVPNAEHEAQSWVIADVAPDLKLLDVWALPAEGTLEEFDSLIEIFTSFDPDEGDSIATRVLVQVRQLLGRILRWDDPKEQRPIPGSVDTTLAARLPANLRGSADSTEFSPVLLEAGARPLYRTEDEWAAEISNATVHAVLHFAWVEQGGGRYRGHMAVYVKPRGLFGELYMKAIQPFRHLIVYPAIMRQLEAAWDARDRA